MKVFLLSGLSSAHTIKWANSLSNKGIEVFVAGLIDFDKSQYNNNIKTFSFNIPKQIYDKGHGSF